MQYTECETDSMPMRTKVKEDGSKRYNTYALFSPYKNLKKNRRSREANRILQWQIDTFISSLCCCVFYFRFVSISVFAEPRRLCARLHSFR